MGRAANDRFAHRRAVDAIFNEWDKAQDETDWLFIRAQVRCKRNTEAGGRAFRAAAEAERRGIEILLGVYR
jgi:hypothetical protein